MESFSGAKPGKRRTFFRPGKMPFSGKRKASNGRFWGLAVRKGPSTILAVPLDRTLKEKWEPSVSPAPGWRAALLVIHAARHDRRRSRFLRSLGDHRLRSDQE